MLWNILKKSALDFWEEILYLILFNIVWLVGMVLIIPYPLVTFGLFGLAYDIGQGKGIKFSTFFDHARRMWKQAYIWGGINLGVLIIFWINLNFYAGMTARWALFAQMVVVAMTIFWGILQVIALPIYPRLEEPNLKLALRNAAVIISRYPLAVVILVMVILIFGLISLFFQALALFGAAAFIAVLANRIVETVVAREMGRQE